MNQITSAVVFFLAVSISIPSPVYAQPVHCAGSVLELLICLEDAINKIKSDDLKTLREESTALREDVKTLRGDLSALREEMGRRLLPLEADAKIKARGVKVCRYYGHADDQESRAHEVTYYVPASWTMKNCTQRMVDHHAYRTEFGCTHWNPDSDLVTAERLVSKGYPFRFGVSPHIRDAQVWSLTMLPPGADNNCEWDPVN